MAAERDKDGKSRIPLLESISAGVGLALLLGMLGFLAYEAAMTDETVPAITVEPTSLTRAGDHFVMEVRVSNYSRRTAAAVNVEGTLKQAGSEIEKSSATFDYVPGKSERIGAVIFSKDPRQFRVDVRATGYERP